MLKHSNTFKKWNKFLTFVIKCFATLKNNFQFIPAFTLAEVLITLGIIGIVAAMTVPTLLNKINDKITIHRLRQSYNLFQNALRLAQDEYGGVSVWGKSETLAQHDEMYFSRITKYLKLTEDCGNANLLYICGNTGWYSAYNNLSTRRSYPGPNHGRAGRLPNGAMFYITTDNINNNKTWGFYGSINIDINGNDRPNSWGKDLFSFRISDQSDAWRHKNNAVINPSGQYYERTKQCLAGTAPEYCAYWALKYNNLDYLYCRDKLSEKGPYSCNDAK